MRRDLRLHPLWVFLSYSLVTVVLFRVIVRGLSTTLPSDPGDPVLNTWILWWNATTLPFTSAWWNPPAYYPLSGVLAFSEHLAGLAPISTPLIWVTGDPIVAYNIAFLLSFPLCGLAVYALALDLTNRRDAAWIAGLAYAFSTYRMTQMAHIQVLLSYGAPLALLGLHRYVQERRLRWLGLFVGAYLMLGLSNGYFLLYFALLAAFWVVWFVPRRDWRCLAAIAGAGVIVMAPLVPILLNYHRIHERYGFTRPLEEIRAYSADMLSVATAFPLLDLWGWLAWLDRPEAQLFPGLTLVLLAGLGVWHGRWATRSVEPRWRVRLRWALGAGAILFLAAAAVRLWIGPWAVVLPGIRFSIEDVLKPVSEAALLLMVLLLISPPVLAARRSHSALGFYVLATALIWLLTLGPQPTLFGRPALTHAPYHWLMSVPGFDGLRVPARFWVFALLCLSMIAAIGWSRALSPSAPRRIRIPVLVLVAAGLLADSWITTLPTGMAPSRSRALETMAVGPVIELPMGNRDHDLAAMYRSIFHGQPVANGHSGYPAPYYPALVDLMNTFDPAALERFASLGVRDVRIDGRNDFEGGWSAWVQTLPGARVVARGRDELLVRLPETTPDGWLAPRSYGSPLPIRGFDANLNDHMFDRTQDGDLWTRWHAEIQTPDDEVVIELDGVHRIGAVVLTIGPYWYDYPRLLRVDISTDGVRWTMVREGPTALHTVEAAFQDPRRLDLTFPLDGASARFIRMRQIGASDRYYWSIAELAVLTPG